MNEALYNLYAITGDPSHLAAANMFDHWSFTVPLLNDHVWHAAMPRVVRMQR